MITLLAQAGAATTTDIYQAQQDAAIGVNRVIEAIQTQMVSSDVFFWASQLAMLIGGVLIGFAAIKTLKSYTKNPQNPMPIVYGLISIVVIVALILNTGGGSNLGTIALAGTKFSNRISETPIPIITQSAGANGNIIEQAGSLSAIRATREMMLTECLKQPKSSERDECLANVVQVVDDAVSPYVGPGGGGSFIDLFGGALKVRSWPEEVLTDTKESVGKYLKEKEFLLTNNFGDRAFQGLVPLFGIPIAGLLFVIGTVFTYLSGLAQSVLILIAPLLAVLSFTEVFRDSFVTWGKNFVQLGLMKLVFNLLVSLAAWANLVANSPDPILFPAIVAILSGGFSVSLIKSSGEGLIGAQARLGAGLVASAVAAKSFVRR